MNNLKRNVLIAVGIILLISIIVILCIVITPNEEKIIIEEPVDGVQEEETSKAPSKLSKEEKTVSEKKQRELFNFIPKVYTESIAPFDSIFMLNAVMDKITYTEENVDYSINNVDKYVTKIFGETASINKEEISEPNIEKSLYYYSKEANSYAVIPVGIDGIYKHQILKSATETDDAYYVYAYTLIGGYFYDENSIVQDEFGDVDYENSKVQVIVGDKDGNDLIHVFDNFSKIYENDIWLKYYSNLMPVFRYTLTKTGNTYYLTEVEQINY